MNRIEPSQKVLSPVKKSVAVGLPVEAAFRLFTEGIDQWWPLATHSVGGEDAEAVYLEGLVGGRIYEVLKDHSQSEWGRVLAWEPPERLVFSWYPGRTPSTAQEVEVTFSPEAGGTRIELIHRGWELLGGRAQAMRNAYDSGWVEVLGKYAAFTAFSNTAFNGSPKMS